VKLCSSIMPKNIVSIINLLLPAAGSIVVKDTGIPHDIGRICRSCVVERPFIY